MAQPIVVASPGTQITNKGIQVSDGVNTRVTVGQINSVLPADYGLRVLSSDGVTVIIDGTSDMFKIAVSASQSVLQTLGNGQAFAEIAYAALAPQTNSLAIVAMVGNSTTSTSERMASVYVNGGQDFDATTSGGAVTHQFVGIVNIGFASSRLTGASVDTPTVRCYNNNETGGAVTLSFRYYILLETAI